MATKTKTDAKLRVTMPDGSKWDVPVQLIADNRDKYYAEDGEDSIALIRGRELGTYDLEDWATNNMNWSDVKAHAVKVAEPGPVDYEDGWANGDKTFIGAI